MATKKSEKGQSKSNLRRKNLKTRSVRTESSNPSKNDFTKNTENLENNNPSNENQEKKLAFDSLISVEREHIARKLRREVLNKEQSVSQFCMDFLKWISEQFKKLGTTPPSPILLSNLEFIQNNCSNKGLFVNSGTEELVNLYYNCIENDVEIKYDDENLDIDSLAIATQKYIEKYIKFFEKDIYIKIYDTYKNSGEKEYIIKRLPFLILNRSIFKEVANIIEKQDELKEQTKVEKTKSYKLWKDTLLNDDLDVNSGVSPQIKAKILEDLLNAEFEYLSPEFYESSNPK